MSRPRLGRGLVLVVVGVMSVWIVGPNIAPGPARDVLDGLWRPAVVLGFDQDWRVFSPDPVDQSLDVYAEVLMADGTVVRWEAPERGLLLGASSEYRWQKWQERVRLDERRELWEPAARWAADQVTQDGAVPVRVTLVRRWIVHRPLTAAPIDDGGWQEFAYYTWTPEAPS